MGKFGLKKLCDLKMGRTKYGEKTYLEVLGMLSSGVVPFNSFLSEPGKDQWTELLKYNAFSEYLVGKLMLAANGYSYDSLFNHWYIKDGQRSFGPFSLIQMLEFYQQNRIHLDNLIRHSTYNQWEAFGQSGPFSQESLEKLIANPDIKNIITRRKHPRINYTNEVFISSRAELYRGVTWSLSSLGLGLVTDQATLLEQNHRVNIIVNSNNDHGAVQVKGRVVNVKKETNYERVAIQFDEANDFLDQYIQRRVPNL